MARALTPAAAQATAHSAAAALPFPPLAGGYVATWDTTDSVSPEFDLILRSSTTSSLTAAELYGAELVAQVLADDAIEAVNTGTEALTLTGHAYRTGDGPLQVSNSGGALPGGLTALTDYWAISVDANTIKLASTLANALANTAVDLTSAGSGTNTIEDTAGTKRLTWDSIGLLGHAADGAVSLTVSKGYKVRVAHSPGTVAYAVSATISAGNITALLRPVRDR